MRLNPISLIAFLFWLAVKWLLLLAASLFVSDMIQLKKEVRHERNTRTQKSSN